MRANGIAFVEKFENPPNAPQIRPIENYWGILKMKVYEGNWKAKTRDHLIRGIKMKQKLTKILSMFDDLKGPFHAANQMDYKAF